MGKKSAALLQALLALALLLTACGPGRNAGGEQDGAADTGPFILTAAVGEAQDTLDPARCTAKGGETILYHLFENLLRWEDGGNGWAALAPGQAESWTADADYAGNTTYTFTLREGLLWSDGKAVTAGDFVTAWRRLADPANELPHRELLAAVAGYGEVQETGDTSLLGVSAPDERTFTVRLNGSSACFLAEVCAGAYTMPVRADLAANGAWGSSASATVTNGPYTAGGLTAALVTLERSETYYDRARVGPERIRFVTGGGGEADYGGFLEGELDLISDLPGQALETLAAGENWTPDPVTEAGFVLVNTQQPPFDDPAVRLAFRLAVDPRAAADAAGDLSLRPAAGLVPYGVADYVPKEEDPADEEAGEPAMPAPNGAPEPCWDFRTHSLGWVNAAADESYEEDCRRAKELMAQAGYPGGGGFPAVEYIYVNSGPGKAIAQSLQAMWREQLGVTVTVRGLSQEEYEAMLVPAPVEEEEGQAERAEEAPRTTGAYVLAGWSFDADRWDAASLLGQWHSGGNLSGYASEAFDILLDSAAAAVSAEAWDAYLHDAEAVLLEDAPVIPVCCRGSGYLLREGLAGLYRAPDGVFFLSGVTAEEA